MSPIPLGGAVVMGGGAAHPTPPPHPTHHCQAQLTHQPTPTQPQPAPPTHTSAQPSSPALQPTSTAQPAHQSLPAWPAPLAQLQPTTPITTFPAWPAVRLTPSPARATEPSSSSRPQPHSPVLCKLLLSYSSNTACFVVNFSPLTLIVNLQGLSSTLVFM